MRSKVLLLTSLFLFALFASSFSVEQNPKPVNRLLLKGKLNRGLAGGLRVDDPVAIDAFAAANFNPNTLSLSLEFFKSFPGLTIELWGNGVNRLYKQTVNVYNGLIITIDLSQFDDWFFELYLHGSDGLELIGEFNI